MSSSEDEITKLRKKRDQKLYDYSGAWMDYQQVSCFSGKKEQEAALWELAAQSFGGNLTNGVFWLTKNAVHRKRSNDIRQVYRCPFYNSHSCPYQFCTIVESSSEKMEVFISKETHNHTFMKLKRGISKQVLIDALPSPSKLVKGSTRLVRTAMVSNRSLQLSREDQNKAIRLIHRQKKKIRTETLSGSDPGSFAGMKYILDMYRRQNCNNFTDHSVFLCGNDYICDSSNGRVGAFLSTENLLLNAYRQSCTGMDLFLAVDTSYRYSYEGFGLLPIKVIDFSQTSHTVGYAIVSHEDHDAHTFVFRMMKQEL
eukprot:CAMPEP_0198141040 /NCGR_PEP_ID=MMETSP1443-20131203/4106_1 /TAXON_ID=186043 /ORGANISM="Entomoneis sp., Strain CCMP2396" /LENGTH=311 /DNA_ID=CAMNT_0043803647 /DNA_START=63 /DNA_END=994 /DNA_ORIENTATION=-